MQCNPEQFQHKSKNATQKQYRAKNQHKTKPQMPEPNHCYTRNAIQNQYRAKPFKPEPINASQTRLKPDPINANQSRTPVLI